ncbi:MAG: VgrG-related protein [Leptolyngbyaceae cyanobacterium bins.349]|nr:VgrG-related protein [Leptolyngbyaceae cyanobacterium bins.349]
MPEQGINSYYTANPMLKIGGMDAPEKLMEDILQISIEESLHIPSMFTLVIRNSAFPGQVGQSVEQTSNAESSNPMWEHERLFSIGKAIKIGFEIETKGNGWVIDGEITAIETHFTSGSQAPLIIRGYDCSHRLYRGHHNRSFQNITDQDIVNKIIGEVGITAGTIDDTSVVHEYVFQENQTNIEFLRERAARNGFELFVQDGKLNFRKPSKQRSLDLEWLRDLTSFQVRVTSAEQVSSVEVRGWDYTLKQAIVANKSQANILTSNEFGQGKNSSSAFQGQPTGPKVVLVDQPVYTNAEATKMAEALFYELSDEFVHADAQAIGDYEIRPGRVVKIAGRAMGKYEGEYYVTETQHVYSERVYRTAFSVRGLRGGSLLSLLSPPQHPQVGQTLLIGIVTNNSDPKKLGRVRVKLPTLTEEHESHWARVVAIGAGQDRGFDCLPEVDDEVLVGFEHGDIHRPFVIGGLWNGKDAPPETVTNSVSGSKVRLRTFKTRAGHYLQFVDEDKGASKKGVCIKTAGGHKIYLNDTEKRIEVTTNGGHFLKLNDLDLSISLESKGSISIKASTTLDLQATGIVTVKGALIKLN